ncbi:hypothetical protein H8E07_22600 [bacterium]|nr:hypothetical protein [bacterium]
MLLAAAAPASAACVDIAVGPLLPVPAPCADFTLDGITIVVYSEADLIGVIGEPPASTYWNHGCVAAGFQNYQVDVGAPTQECFASVFKYGNGTQAQAMFDDPTYGAIGLEFATWPGTGPHRFFVWQDGGLIYFRERCFYCIVGAPIANDDITPLWCLAHALLASIGEVVETESLTWSALKRMW